VVASSAVLSDAVSRLAVSKVVSGFLARVVREVVFALGAVDRGLVLFAIHSSLADHPSLRRHLRGAARATSMIAERS
jgi:hypothetical protein